MPDMEKFAEGFVAHCESHGLDPEKTLMKMAQMTSDADQNSTWEGVKEFGRNIPMFGGLMGGGEGAMSRDRSQPIGHQIGQGIGGFLRGAAQPFQNAGNFFSNIAEGTGLGGGQQMRDLQSTQNSRLQELLEQSKQPMGGSGPGPHRGGYQFDRTRPHSQGYWQGPPPMRNPWLYNPSRPWLSGGGTLMNPYSGFPS